MLQLNYSSSGIENKTVYIDTNYTGSEVKVYLSSSFSGDVTEFTSDIVSNKTSDYGGWILLEIDRNNLPTDSGQYDANIYELEPGSSGDTWVDARLSWVEVTDTWLGYSPGEIVGALLAYERALVSGSDYDTINKYNYENKSNYTVYNG